jgi:KamA family protein
MFDNETITAGVTSHSVPLAPPAKPGMARKYRAITLAQLDHPILRSRLSAQARFEIRVVASVLPFRVNNYVIRDLIDWSKVPDDPIFRLTFPHRDMLEPQAFEAMAQLHRREASREEIAALAGEIRAGLNPHPAGQIEMNLPRTADGRRIDGLQHKYRETVLFFPKNGQVCHAYCTFCFRWAQFIGDKRLRIAAPDVAPLLSYLRAHPEVSDLLMTGGDPMIMRTANLRAYLEPLLEPEFDHLQNLRFGTKALTFWPYRFVSDPDAADLLRLLETLVESGKHVAIMAHFNHWREMQTPVAHEAIRRLRDAGAEIRTQSPLLAHINDTADTWAEMWREQVRLGMFPYYMFVERDTGARRYFEVPLARAWEIYQGAMQQLSGLARTARGPSMSADPGKVEVQGITEIDGEKVFVLRFIQGRNADWVQQPFFAHYDPNATWLDELRPWRSETFFFEREYEEMCRAR